MIYAGFWRRLFALAVDNIILSIILSIFMLDRHISVMEGFISFVIIWLYFTLFKLSEMRATPGQRLLGIELITLDGKKLDFSRLTLRHFMKIISAIFFIGYLISLFTKRRQTLHDIVAGTVVIRSDFSKQQTEDRYKSPNFQPKPEQQKQTKQPEKKEESYWSKKPRDIGFDDKK